MGSLGHFLPTLKRIPCRKYSFALIFFSVMTFSLMPHASAAITEIKVNPASSTIKSIGNNTSIAINIVNVTSLKGWEFKLYYQRSILNCTGIIEGPFLQGGGSTFPVFQFNNTYNATYGRVLAGCALLGLGLSVSGSGTLANVTFKAVGLGSTVLSLIDTKLAGPGDPPPSINHIATSGTINVGSKPGDVTGDGKVNVLDLIKVAIHLGTKVGDPTWDPICDVNGDGKVNVLDLIFVAIRLGT